jgi:plasmid replication initiation protein
MKKLMFIAIAFFAFTFIAAAQTTRDDNPNDNQDQLQQQPTRPSQSAVENSARQANVNQQNAKSRNEAEEWIRKEKEKSTGKDTKNPAEDKSTIKPVHLTDPVSTPVKQN